MEYKDAWNTATLEEKKEMLKNERKAMDDRIEEAYQDGKNKVITDAGQVVKDALVDYYTLGDPADLEKARNYFKAYEAIDLLTKRDWMYLSARTKNLVAEVEAKERAAADERRDADAAKAEKRRQAEMMDKVHALRR